MPLWCQRLQKENEKTLLRRKGNKNEVSGRQEMVIDTTHTFVKIVLAER